MDKEFNQHTKKFSLFCRHVGYGYKVCDDEVVILMSVVQKEGRLPTKIQSFSLELGMTFVLDDDNIFPHSDTYFTI